MMQKIVGGRLEEPDLVEIGGHRVGAAVVVEVDEARSYKAGRTQMRASGLPRKR